MVRITKEGGFICFTVRKQEWEAAPYKKTIDKLVDSNSLKKIVHNTSDYNIKEDISCQLCLYQKTY